MSDRFRTDQLFLAQKSQQSASILSFRLLRYQLICIFLVFAQNSLHAEIRWTPDGLWFAYRQENSSQPLPVFEPGWLFNPARFLEPQSTPPNQTAKSIQTIWIGRSDLNFWHKLASSTLFLSDPAWSLDGRFLYYAAAETSPDNSLTWRIHQVSSLGNPTTNPGDVVIWESKLSPGWQPKPIGTMARSILNQLQAGPDRLLIFADPLRDELLLFRADTQEIAARFPGGHLAKINPTGEWVAWLRSEIWPAKNADLILTKINEAVHTTRLQNVLPDSAPVFSADGQALYIARHQKPPEALSVPSGSDWPELARIELKTLKATRYSALVATPVLPAERLSGISFTLDPDEELLLYSPAISPRPVEIIWFQPKTAATYKRFPPIDLHTEVSSLALSLNDQLALRFGHQTFPLESAQLPAGLCELISEQIHPFTPDDAARQVWGHLLVTNIARIIYNEMPSPEKLAESRTRPRFSLIPEIEQGQGDSPASLRLRRVANIGLRSLGMDPKRVSLKDLEKLTGWQIEAAALFLILTNHHAEALKALEMIGISSLTETDRARLIALIAQEQIAQGDSEQALLILTELLRFEPKVLGQIESDGAGGWSLTPTKTAPWFDHLKKLAEAAANPPRSAEGTSPINPLGHVNPDDPENDPDLKMQVPLPELKSPL